MYTRHAETRCQQRGIKPEVIDAILAYGRRKRRFGADVYFMDSKARSRAMAELGRSYAKVSDRLNTYLVISDDGQMITAGKRLGRLKF
ncbi:MULTISPECIES: DUF4258 domain-containing protein [Phyllobacteriaceae]|uniref:Endonuclease III-like uncharacterized protein n=1 Tax=Aminobacter ciceronei TaxID=150723 RepID=A0ABR6C8L9_9HYPH|nr:MULTISPECIES: DUF4258 domain-containing protein [Phyllobacteriaceae]MBA8907487.1 endonuclease III-like uncharacterized protein [Aminobacter ciceronei]MBA9021251.1 endonuclease III-like uncharacterized protein [Aminobacter ciceronei]RUW29451.1 DUF4258 domain-containing protein [Mesorhizobium sp. M2A.F.Ca.ET.015.02.1.1]RUW37688.1 DUF4258 domain-containing protein [Mesorhizobium sp. M1E.F.Ca.ET.041.01.1.1]RVC88398.1 DUF4258 domain-containing protein [Mesorhizobium sp. M2A.F.Ca.ET.017.03.2.1]